MSFLNALSGSSLGFLGNLFGGSDSSTNSNTNFNQNTDTSQKSNASTQRTLTPYQTSLQSPLFDYVRNLMTPGGAEAALQPFYTGARDSTNQNYAGLADTLRQQFMGSGGGESGKFGSALVQGNLNRLGDLSKVDTGFQQEAAQLPLTASSLAEQLLGMPFGSTSTANQTGTSATTGSTTTKSSTSGVGFHI